MLPLLLLGLRTELRGLSLIWLLVLRLIVVLIAIQMLRHGLGR
jgi:hypothetical protein